jgi:hypothetical protein
MISSEKGRWPPISAEIWLSILLVLDGEVRWSFRSGNGVHAMHACKCERMDAPVGNRDPIRPIV